MNREERRARAKAERRAGGTARTEALATMRRVIGIAGSPVILDDNLMEQPDVLKYAYACWCRDDPAVGRAMRSLVSRIVQGPLGGIPDIDHWAMEAFFWAGHTYDGVHPLDSWLATQNASRLSAASRARLQLWKQAEFGAWSLEGASGDAVVLRRYDPVRGVAVGEPRTAIDLAIAGTRPLQAATGRLHLAWLAPWQGASHTHSLLGYGATIHGRRLGPYEQLLDLGHAAAAQPLPWKVPGSRHLDEWRRRDWQSWLAARMTFPWRLLWVDERTGAARPVVAQSMVPLSPEVARSSGVYFALEQTGTDGLEVVGLTNFVPLDLAHPGYLPLLEYQAWREIAGPPPAVADAPGRMTFGGDE